MPRTPAGPPAAAGHPREASDTISSKSAIPTYGNLVPRDIATREIFKVCIHEGLSVQADRMCVYLDVTHLPRDMLDRKLAGVLEIYEKFQGADPRTDADEDLPRRPLLDGRAVVRLRGQQPRRPGRRLAAQPADQHPRRCSPSASATTSSTAPTGWGPTRWWPAFSAG